MSDILRIAVPLTVWLAAFSAVYGLEGLVCSDRWAEAGLSLATGRTALILAWGIATLIQVAFVLALRSRCFASPSTFVHSVSLSLAAVALVATVWALIPVAITTACL